MTAREMRERRGKCADEMKLLSTEMEACTEKGKLTELNNKFDAFDAEQEDLRVKIEASEKAERLTLETRTGAPPAAQPGSRLTPDQERERYARAFNNYLRFGMRARPEVGIRGVSEEDRLILSPQRRAVNMDGSAIAEMRDMGTGGGGAYPGSTVGFEVPVGFVNSWTEAMRYYGNMLNEASIMDTATGQPLPFPTDNDTTVFGELIAEGQQVTTADVSLGQIIFGAYKFSTKMVKVSIELLQDSAFDLQGFLIKKFAIRTGRILNQMLTTGTGTLQPTGCLTATVTGGLFVTAVGASGNDGGAETGGTSLGSDDFINLEHAIDPLYRPGAKYMFHDTVLRSVKKIKDKYGRPLWQPGIAEKQPDMINGYMYSINNDMPVIALSAKTVVFGQLANYMIRRVKDMNVLRLEERFADYGQVAFLGFSRYDGNLLDAGTHPLAYLVQAAA